MAIEQDAATRENERALSGTLLFDDEGQDAPTEPENTTEAEAAPPPARERDVYDDMLDNDPEVRELVKSEIKRRLLVGDSGTPPAEREPTPIEKIQGEIVEHETWTRDFMQLPEDQRDYREYENRRNRVLELTRKEAQLMSQQAIQAVNVSQAGQIVESFINEAIAEEERRFGGQSQIRRFVGDIRKMANSLTPDVRGDPAKLRNALRYYVLPNAKSDFLDAERERQRTRRARSPQEDTAGSEAYMDGSDSDEKPKGKYTDASPEEREFLKGLGLLKDAPDKQASKDLIPIEGGFVIPVGRGRRNEGGGA